VVRQTAHPRDSMMRMARFIEPARRRAGAALSDQRSGPVPVHKALNSGSSWFSQTRRRPTALLWPGSTSTGVFKEGRRNVIGDNSTGHPVQARRTGCR
jgi:hypothetical protein